jgi:enoyl-[acyl-carrier protein] reductase II
MNEMTDMLGCRHPIILGAMGVICNPELVAAVSEAGGFGLLATAFVQDVNVLRRQIQETKKLTGKAVEDSWLKGNLEAGVLPAGEVSGLISSISTVGELIDEMVNG